ncbi:Uncharacterized protein SCF082_LOCUS50900, partial [Durusdinium trenchii]
RAVRSINWKGLTMGCKHGTQAQAEAPQVSVTAPLGKSEEGGGLLLGRIGERSPARGNQKNENEDVKGPPAVSNKLLLPIRKQPDQAQVEREEIDRLLQAVSETLPPNGRICILGGTEMHNPETKPLVQAVAERLARQLPSDAVVLTGGMAGIQEQMVKSLSLHGFQKVVNLVHMGHERSYGIGEDLCAGLDVTERKKVFGAVGDVYLCLEGGPGVAEEAAAAFARGARIIPLMALGGAGSGEFHFPLDALETPHWSSSKDWAALTAPLPGHREDMADAVVRLVLQALQDPRSRGRHARNVQDSSPDVVVTGPGPLWFIQGCGLTL